MSLKDKYKDIKLPDPNMYIADSDRAVELMGDVLREDNGTEQEQFVVDQLIDDIFAKSNVLTIENELDYYQRFKTLADRLIERYKLVKIADKTVVSLGGKFSSGKSKFINSIANTGDLLPESQSPTTSIPTYILKGEDIELTGNSNYGYKIELTVDSMKALTHEFHEKYEMGFSPFIESIVISTPEYSVNENVVLLDTPGYTKFDESSIAKSDFSDRTRAFNQLKITDYLIWLIDIHNGEITVDDIEFIDSLNIQTPILIVFNKADIKTEKDIELILNKAREIVERDLSTKCFGVTAYSSLYNKEYGDNFIERFMEYAANSEMHSNDIMEDFVKLEEEMRDSIRNEIEEQQEIVDSILDYIKDTDSIFEIRSLTELCKSRSQIIEEFNLFLEYYNKFCDLINENVKRLTEGV